MRFFRLFSAAKLRQKFGTVTCWSEIFAGHLKLLTFFNQNGIKCLQFVSKMGNFVRNCSLFFFPCKNFRPSVGNVLGTKILSDLNVDSSVQAKRSKG
jgi:hypothetical protein